MGILFKCTLTDVNDYPFTLIHKFSEIERGFLLADEMAIAHNGGTNRPFAEGAEWH
jgi:hypothetical protein